eukprot:15459735-Alexandrium_andersonii.AAC.1
MARCVLASQPQSERARQPAADPLTARASSCSSAARGRISSSAVHRLTAARRPLRMPGDHNSREGSSRLQRRVLKSLR